YHGNSRRSSKAHGVVGRFAPRAARPATSSRVDLAEGERAAQFYRIWVQRLWNEACTCRHVSADDTKDLMAIRLRFVQDNGTTGEAVVGRSVKQSRFDSVVVCVAGNHRPHDKRTRLHGVA